MAIISSFGALQAISSQTAPVVVSGGGSATGRAQTYGMLYRTQPNVRTVVDFLARNIAQLGLHAFRRMSDTDRTRLPDHEVIQWVTDPNPATTRFRLFESLMCDLGIYYNAYLLKVRLPERVGLLRLPPEQMTIEGKLLPSAYIWTNPQGEKVPFKTTEVMHFHGYDPHNPLAGLSPLETLRRLLAEEAAANEYRNALWNNAARFEGVIERPLAAPRWLPDQKTSWRTQWQEAFGRGGSRVGQVAVLEDGMTFKQASFSAKETEYITARKLSREECAAAYHVPLPMVGILEHATFSNIKEQHKHLYQDCLGPWLEMITEEFEKQLLVEAVDQDDVYLEFNIAEKLKGSFEEQSASLQAAVGKPWMTVNEARGRMNYPRDDAPASDQIAAQQGGPATTPALPPATDDATDGVVVDTEADAEAIASVVHAHQLRQRARLDKHDAIARPEAFTDHRGRWRRELADDLTPLVGARKAEWYAGVANAQMLVRLRAEASNA